MINKLITKVMKRDLSGSEGHLGHGSNLPPCLDKVLTCHTGAVVKDTLVNDTAGYLGNQPLEMRGGPCLTFDGSNDQGVLDLTVLSGDFEISFNIQDANIVDYVTILNGTDFKNLIRFLTIGSNNMQVYINNNSYIFPITSRTAEAYYTIRRVDNQLTLEDSGGTSSTQPCVTDAFEVRYLSGRPDKSRLISGRVWNLRIKNTVDIHFPCIGKTSSVNPTSIYATDGTEMILTSSDYAALWGGTQDNYFYEVINGYWEDANGRYPYAHVGATKVNPGWDYPMNSFKFKENGVGSFDGVGDKIALSPTLGIEGNFTISFTVYSMPAGASTCIVGTGGAGTDRIAFSNTDSMYVQIGGTFVEFGNITKRAGVFTITRSGADVTISVKDQEETKTVSSDTFVIDSIGVFNSGDFFTEALGSLNINGLIIPLNDGEIYGDDTTDIHDNKGNIVGSLVSSDVPAFWSIFKVPYSVQDMDAVHQMFTDINGNALPLTQETLEQLSNETVDNPIFLGTYTAGLSPYWAKSGSPTVSEEVGLYGSTAQGVTDGDAGNVVQDYVEYVEGETYLLTVTAKRLSGTGAGYVRLLSSVIGASADVLSFGNDYWETKTYMFNSIANTGSPLRLHAPTGTLCAFGHVSVRPVKPLINNNEQYFLGPEDTKKLTLYENNLAGFCLINTRRNHGLNILRLDFTEVQHTQYIGVF